MSKKVLYLECFSGISGDMTVGALLDLGADPEVLKQSLDLLHVEGYEIKIGRSSKCGIDACDFDVLIPDQPEYDEGHMHHHHDEDHGHAHEHHHHDEDHEYAHEHHHHDEDHD
ncbi:LarC family nickel insertion protein, partial [Coprococcus catus]